MPRRQVQKPPTRRSPTQPGPIVLTERMRRFVEEYLVDLNATQAAIRAGYSKTSATDAGYELLGNPRVIDAISVAMQARSERTQVTADDVLRRWWTLANADARELIEYRRTCCRWCHGKGHRYQWTQGELDKHHEDQRDKEADAKWKRDERGGVGYDPRRPPHPECPECFGDGVGEVVAKDTRQLSPAAQALYAGVKTTKEGLEIKMRAQDEALVNVAKHLGMFVERHGGPDGGPITHAVTVTRRIVRPGET